MSTEQVMQALIGILSVVATGLSEFALKSIVDLGRIQAGMAASIEERKEMNKEKFQELRNEVERSTNGVRAEMVSNLNGIQRELSQVQSGITAIHKRLDRSADESDSNRRAAK